MSDKFILFHLGDYLINIHKLWMIFSMYLAFKI